MSDYSHKILIVDNDPQSLAEIRDTLVAEGHVVTAVSDLDLAHSLFLQDRPALAIVAASAGEAGLALCEAVRKLPEMEHVPILLTAESSDLHTLNSAYEKGVTDLVAKPVNSVVVRQRIRHLLRSAVHHRQLQEHQVRLRAAEAAERQRGKLFEAALRNMSQGVCMYDSAGRVIVTNRRFSEIYQLPPGADWAGRPLTDLLRDSPLLTTGEDEAVRRGIEDYSAMSWRTISLQMTQTLNNGQIITIAHEPMEGGGFVDTYTDITEQRLAEAQLNHIALHDLLTDLPNRTLFRGHLTETLNRLSGDERCAVVCVNLDQFRSVNDTLGHPIGDLLLRQMAHRLAGMLGPHDFLARLGGDEFAIIQTKANLPLDAMVLAYRIIKSAALPYRIEGHDIVVGASIGISVAPSDGTNPDRLLKAADTALHQAKADGRNHYRFFETEMDAQLQTRRQLEVDLRAALPAGQLEMHYQPLVALNGDHISGFEALMRWRHPQRGMISPGDFIPLAEETGLIVEMGSWALERACRDAATWPDPIKVAVNVSVVQFLQSDVVAAVDRALRVSGLAPHRLEVEITESLLIENVAGVMAILHQLKELGVHIAMDDFGTGYSSLSYLRSFPFDKVKVDQSFVRELGEKADAVAIIRAVAHLCAALNVVSTAEGVENPQQLALLRDCSFTQIQGYLVSKPRPVAEIQGLLEDFAREGLPREVLS